MHLASDPWANVIVPRKPSVQGMRFGSFQADFRA